jgi:predicted nucleic acid-binding Zn finger protein
VRLTAVTPDTSGAYTLQGEVQDKDHTYTPAVTIDADERITHAICSCNWYQQNKLFKGPCEHMLALRMQHNRQNFS